MFASEPLPSGPPGAPRVGELSRVVLRPIANPMAFAFLGLAVATIVSAALNLGWIPVTEQHEVALVLISFAFPVQALSTVFAFLSRDTTAVSGIGLQAVGWLTLGLLLLTGHPGARSDAGAIFLFAASAALLPPAAGAALGKVLPALVIVGTALRFVLTGLWEHFGGDAWAHAAGWEGVVLCILALYVSFAAELESVRHRVVLPLGRHGAGRKAATADLAGQLHHLEREAGVREQL